MTQRPLRPESAAIVSVLRSGVSRRRFLASSGAVASGLALSACGIGDTSEIGASGTPEAKTQEDRSDQDKRLNWSNWPLYIDVDDESGERPTLEAFMRDTGIDVTYTEDVNDNNEFYAKVRAQLDQGQDIDRDLVVLTDWMAALWIQNGFAQKLDKAAIPNGKNLIPRLQNVEFDPDRDFTLPWQSGFGGLGYNVEMLRQAMGVDSITTVDQLFDPRLRGRVTVLSEMRDTMGVLLGWKGYDAANFTDPQWNETIAALTEQVDSGQIRQVTGNDYIAALENGDVIAVIGWSGDVFALGEGFGFSLPETGATLWTDNMLIPAMAQHKANAEKVMNYYYEPEVAAEVAAYVQYICPVEGAQKAMEKIDPELVDNPYIFPTPEELERGRVFMSLSIEQNEIYQRQFQSAIGN